MKIGFIGLGVMGQPMAGHLLQAGHAVSTCVNRTPVSDRLRQKGIAVLETPRAVAQASEVVIAMLPDTPDVGRVLLGAEGVIEGAAPGTLVIDMSSIDPIATRQYAAAFRERGCDYLDAPVSGGQVGAEAASLTVMVGGTSDAYERALPLLRLMGKNITLVGDSGAGQCCKIANQIIVASNIAAVAEALVFATKAGCDPAKVREALMGGFAASRVLEVHGNKMIGRTFEPGFRVRLHQKDLGLALDAARHLGVSLPGAAMCQQLFNGAKANGMADSDHSSLVTELERMAAITIAKE